MVLVFLPYTKMGKIRKSEKNVCGLTKTDAALAIRPNTLPR